MDIKKREKMRIPCIPLDYSERHKAELKELMVDYDTGNIYVVSAQDKSVIFDITAQIREKIDNISGDKIEVNIEGIGDVNLTEILHQLRTELGSSVKAIEMDTDNVNYVSRQSVYDNKSIECIKNVIGIKGFRDARELSVLRKRNGVVEWATIDDAIINGEGGLIGKPPHGQSQGDGSIIPPGNPDNGGILSCIIQQPVNGKIFLKSSRRQKSKNIAQNCVVYLPTTLDEYAEIMWYVVTNSFAPELKFFGNIVWKNNVRLLSPNSHHILKFNTWDHGDTWLGEIVAYDAEVNENGSVSKAYLEKYYYNKASSDSNFVTKTELKESYLDADQISSKYYDKVEIDENHYDKQAIEKFLEFKDRK